MRQFITGFEIANAVRMLRCTRNGTFLLVEGPSDERFWQRFTDLSVCQIQIAHGKSNCIDAIDQLNASRFHGVIGIVDADFDPLLKIKRSITNLFETDTHDLETMLLKSDAFARLLGQLEGSLGPIGQPSKLIARLVQAAAPIGALRLVSIKDRLRLQFNNLRYDAFIDSTLLTTDIVTMVQLQPGISGLEREATVGKVRREANREVDPWVLCCGHDLLEILALHLSCHYAKRGWAPVTATRICDWLTQCYDSGDLARTRLYERIRDWQDGERGTPVLRVFN